MSVFRASNSSTAWPESAEPFLDGPTERLGERGDGCGGGRARLVAVRRGVILALLLAVLALLVAAAAGVLAWRALERAGPAYPRPAETPVVAYGEEKLRIPAGCTGVTFLDLDEPRVGAAGAAGDLRYDSRCGGEASRLALAPGAVAGSDAGDPGIDAPGCAKAIRTGPLGGGVLVPVEKGVVLCVLTGSPPAGSRLVRVEVAEAARDGRAVLHATSWPAAAR